MTLSYVNKGFAGTALRAPFAVRRRGPYASADRRAVAGALT